MSATSRVTSRLTSRLTKNERRTAIVRAVRRVFADKGLDGATTRELADAAGVSEALLFKHFPTKSALFEAMKDSCCTERDRNRFEKLKMLDPSASTLVLMVHFLVSVIVRKRDEQREEQQVQARLILRSLCEEGEFARIMLEPMAEEWIAMVERCHQAAVEQGDAAADPVPLGLRGWFVHHVPAMAAFISLPDEPAIDYGVGEARLIEQIVWFCLRGMGVKDRVIRRDYNPKALALLQD